MGREVPLGRLATYLTSSALHPTIEGDNGVGKTSLVAVAGYRLRTDFEEGRTNQALLPLPRAFQLTKDDTAATLAERVFYSVAAAFITNASLLGSRGYEIPDVADVNKWLNSPLFYTVSGGVQVLGSGGEFSRGSEPNTSVGFGSTGFASTVSRWLSQTFPTRESGGFICVIDNLELLETSQAARSLLESMRDSVLDLPGLRWVLCGARGIVRTGAASQRLEGRLAEPMELLPIDDREIPQVIESRIEVFKNRADAVPPVGPEGFRYIYDVLNRNLRNALKFCEDFSFWLYENPRELKQTSSYFDLLEVWLTEQADRYNEATSLGNRAWEVFDGIAESGGSASPSDYASFGFASSMAMRPHVKALEDANLVQSTVDDSDRRRKTIVITPRGWLVKYSRSGYQRPGY